jgi:D-alanyl-D-alanine carboxypeptidase
LRFYAKGEKERNLKVFGNFKFQISGILLSLLSGTFTFSNSIRAYESAILIDAQTGKILYSENENEIKYPASLAKLMTLYLTFDALERGIINETDTIKVSKNASRKPATKLNLKPGDKLTYQDAILALIIKSANDAAAALAENIAGSEQSFADLMTQAAQEIGMKNTQFKNASGLYNEKQTSTAKDIALLSLALYKHFPRYYKYFKAKSFEYKGRTYSTHNNILNIYDGADGFKTGYINSSGYNLSASAFKETEKGTIKRLIGVILGSDSPSQRDQEMIRLLDYGFNMLQINNNENFLEAKNQYYVKNIPQNQTASIYKTSYTAQNKGNYSVQVGAFANQYKAYKELSIKQQKISQIGSFPTKITTTEKNGKTLYRARFTNLNRKTANRICSFLKLRKESCFVVSPNLYAMK